ncbi:MAG: lipase [Acidimicrobiia bacterium]
MTLLLGNQNSRKTLYNLEFPSFRGPKLATVLACGLLAVTAACKHPQTREVAGEVNKEPLSTVLPVVLVHGWNGQSSDFSELVKRLVSFGYPQEKVQAFNYYSRTSNRDIATQLGEFINQVLSDTGAPQVDVVAFSMGTLSSRYCLKFLSCTGLVRKYISIAGPHHGSQLAQTCAIYDIACEEMVPGSGVLSQLNAGDETPGDTKYFSLWSKCDGLVYPPESSLLEGATNVEMPCIHHLEMLNNSVVLDRVLAILSS